MFSAILLLRGKSCEILLTEFPLKFSEKCNKYHPEDFVIEPMQEANFESYFRILRDHFSTREPMVRFFYLELLPRQVKFYFFVKLCNSKKNAFIN